MPPAALTVKVSMTAIGDVSDYDTVMRVSLVSTFAASIDVPVSDVSLTITAASVQLLFTIAIADAEAAAAVSNQVDASFQTAAGATSVLGIEVETNPVIIMPTPPFAPTPPTPPPLATPLPPLSVTANETDDSVETATDNVLTITLGGEWYVLAGGLFATAFVLVFGTYSKAKAKLRFPAILSIFIAAGDAFTDIAFTAQQLHSMESLKDHVSALLLLLFLVLPIACSGYQVILALRSPLLDTEKLQDFSAYYAFVLLIALTNMEVLRVLPWRDGTANYDGLPDQGLMVRVWLTVMFLEDLPQFCLQLMLTLSSKTGLLAPLSLTFTMAAVIWRALRKAIYLVPVTTSPQTVLSLNSQRESAEIGSTLNSLPQLPLTSTWSWSKSSRSKSGCSGHVALTAPTPTLDTEPAVQAGLGRLRDSTDADRATLEEHIAARMARVRRGNFQARFTTTMTKTHTTPWAAPVTTRGVDGRKTSSSPSTASPMPPEDAVSPADVSLTDPRQSQLQALSLVEAELAGSDSDSDARI